MLRRHEERLEGKPVPNRYETVIVRKDERAVPTETAAARTTWQGKPATMLFIRDISEREQAEEELRRKEEHLRALTENSSDGIMILNGDGTIRYVSPSCHGLPTYREARQSASSRLGTVCRPFDP